MFLVNYSSESIRREQQLPEQPPHLKEEVSVREVQAQGERRKKEVIIDG
jgi:hypothetical protein